MTDEAVVTAAAEAILAKVPVGYGMTRDEAFTYARVALAVSVDQDVLMVETSRANIAKASLKAIIDAWDALPEGYHSPGVISLWLRQDMQPAISSARWVLED